MIRKEELTLTKEWDKTFPKSEKVDHSKVTFVNRHLQQICTFQRMRKESFRPSQ